MKARLFSVCFALLIACFVSPYTIKAEEIEDSIEIKIEATEIDEENKEAIEGIKGKEAV